MKVNLTSPVLTGLDRCLREGFPELTGKRVALLAHAASVDRNLHNILDLLFAARVNVVRVFGPEHGFFAVAQDMEPVNHLRRSPAGADSHKPSHRCEFVSLYGTNEASLKPDPGLFEDVDLLLADLMDVGSRYYTYVNTIVFAAETALSMGKEVLLLDRPNPLGRHAEGPLIHDGFFSFVGLVPMPVRHGLTVAELVRYALSVRKRVSGLEGLRVVPCLNWDRNQWLDETGLPWVLPSPNMPTLETATVYPGGCLLEGTTLSEGRGTTRPFEFFGAPGIDGSILSAEIGPVRGAILRPVLFKPTFQKHSGRVCGGVQIHVTDRKQFSSWSLTIRALATILRCFPESFGWRTDAYEFVHEIPAFDLLAGSDSIRLALCAGDDPEKIVASHEHDPGDWMERTAPFRLYP